MRDDEPLLFAIETWVLVALKPWDVNGFLGVLSINLWKLVNIKGI